MAKATNNPLASLNLSGLSQLEDISQAQDAQKEAFRAAARPQALPVPQAPTLGPLTKLPGTWVGTGFNIIELPNMNQIKPGPPPADKFRVELNSTSETLTFSAIEGGIFNRGNAQADIEYLGLHYLQQVSDVNLPKNANGIHLETGLFLNLPAGTDPAVKESVARLGSIPHGDSLLAQGRFFTVQGGPQFTPADATPFFIVDGKRQNDTSGTYLALLNNAAPPSGIPKEAILNPNIILENAIKGQNIIETIVILLDANPIEGVCNPGATPATGGITNIPFVNVNANATSLTAIFWIETVQNPDGSTFLQLQYTQTVILDFPVFGPPPTSPVTPISWPHISVATLKLQ